MIIRKGVWTAIKATQSIGAKLILAGQTDPEIDIRTLPKHCTYVGVVNSTTRNELMGNAIATFTPTEYLEPFCGVHIESQLTGTPVLTTNFGVFPETVVNGKNGFRSDTLDDFIWAANAVKSLDRKIVRQYGERYVMDRVQFEYQKWFEDLYQLYLSSKDDKVKGWHNIRKQTPEWRKLWT
jgi:glycosyltransferase involved in cell wall biosynthesis